VEALGNSSHRAFSLESPTPLTRELRLHFSFGTVLLKYADRDIFLVPVIPANMLRNGVFARYSHGQQRKSVFVKTMCK